MATTLPWLNGCLADRGVKGGEDMGSGERVLTEDVSKLEEGMRAVKREKREDSRHGTCRAG